MVSCKHNAWNSIPCSCQLSVFNVPYKSCEMGSYSKITCHPLPFTFKVLLLFLYRGWILGNILPVPRVNLSFTTQGPVTRHLVSANHWLRGIKAYRFPWHLMLVMANHASSNAGQAVKSQNRRAASNIIDCVTFTRTNGNTVNLILCSLGIVCGFFTSPRIL